MIFYLVAVTQLLDAEELGGGLENHAVNGLLRQMDFMEPDMSFALAGLLLLGDVEPILLFHRVAAPLVVTGDEGFFGLGFRGIVQAFTDENTARRAGGDGGGTVLADP